MPPINRERRKRTIYLGPTEEAAVEVIRRKSSMNTKASAIRWAILTTERSIRKGPGEVTTAAQRLIEYIEEMALLCDRDTRELHVLCTQLKATLKTR